MAKIRFLLDNFYDSAAVKASAIDKMVFTNVNIGAVSNSSDVDTGFTFTVLINGLNDPGGAAESTRIQFVDGSLLDAKYWLFYTPAQEFYVWYNTGSSTDPGPIPNKIGIEVNINQIWFDDIYEVASKTRIALDLSPLTNGFITIDDNGFVSTLPATNLKNISRSQLARTETVDTDEDGIKDEVGFQLWGTFSSQKSITSSIVFGRHNFPEKTTYKIRFYSDNAYTSQIGDDIVGQISAEDAGSNLVGWGNFNWGEGTWVPSVEGTETFEPDANYVHWLDKTTYADAWSFKIDVFAVDSTNQLTHSNYFIRDETEWVGVPEGALFIITPEYGTAPDGTQTSWLFDDQNTTVVNTDRSQYVYLDKVNEDWLTYSVYLKEGTSIKTSIHFTYSLSGSFPGAPTMIVHSHSCTVTWTDPLNPVFFHTSGSTGSGGMEDIGDGWYRYWLLAKNNGTNIAAARAWIRPVSFTTSGDDTDMGSVEVWGAQVEDAVDINSVPSEFVETSETNRVAIIDHVDVGRIFIGDYIEPTYNLGYGHTLQWIENTQQFRTQAGTLRSDSAIPFRKFNFDLSVITEADRIILQHEFRAVGLRLDFYFSAFSDATDEDRVTDYSAIAKITKVPKFTEFQCSYYKSKYELEEV